MRPRFVVGQELRGPVRCLSAARILAFSGGPFDAPGWPAKNLHTDAAKAAEAGLAAPIVSGVQCESDIIRLLEATFGVCWFSRGTMTVKYPRPVVAETRLQAMARVTNVEPGADATVVTLEVWCQTGEGTKVVVGTASCVLAGESA